MRNTRLQRTRRPFGRRRRHGAQCLAVVTWLALAIVGCRTATGSKDLPIWRIELWNTEGDYLGAVLVELTGSRVHGEETGHVLEVPPGVQGVGKEAEVSIDRGWFRMSLNRGQVEGFLFLEGAFQGSVASGEAQYRAYVGLRVGTFKARRVS